MVNRNLLRQFDVSDDEMQLDNLDLGTDWLPNDEQDFRDNKLVTGRVLRVTGEGVWVDVGYKSEGVIELREWFDDDSGQVVPPKVGDTLQVLLEAVQDETGAVVLSHRKAKRQQEWDQVIQQYKEGDTVSGVVTRKIKGGLLVNIGAHVFLPASQVDIRRPTDIGQYIGKTIECKILIIDEARRNIVVSRRKLIEDQRVTLRETLLAEIEPGQIRKGVVKNIAEFGAFVDLGGIDGLLHITDMSWHRISSPHEVVKVDQELEVFIIRVDKEKEKIALGLKQKTPSPWTNIDTKYPISSRHTGEVVNVMSYGAFVKLEPGIEGLVHISEMSWTKRINHPSEVVAIGDQIEVQVLNINRDKQEISLGMKQVQANPWDKVAERYPPGTVITGTVRNLTNYGAFIEIEEGIDGLLHVSDMSWVRKVSHPSEVVAKGDKVTCVVLNVDQERKRIALGLKQMASDPWEGDIPGRYHPGDIKKGKVTKLTNFGVFVELEQGLEGLLHISELADHKVESPEEVVKVGDEIEVKVLRVDAADRKIGLSRKNMDAGPETEDAAGEPARAKERHWPQLVIAHIIIAYSKTMFRKVDLMWEYEHSIEAAASAAAIYRLYSDVATWPRWDDGIACLTLDGPFAVGTTGVLTPKGQEPLPFRLTDVWPNRGFADETEIPGAGVSLRFVHSLTPLAGGGTRVTHRLTISGPAADALGPVIGPDITQGFPETLASLARHALAF